MGGSGSSAQDKERQKEEEAAREKAMLDQLKKLIHESHYELLTPAHIIRRLEQHFQMQLNIEQKDRVKQHVDEALRGHFRTRYKVGKVLGKGGYSTVHVCSLVDEPTMGERAVKVLDKSKLSKNALKSLTDEIRVMQTLSHPRLLRLYEVFDHGAMTYLVLEKIEGGELFDEIVRLQRYAEKDAAEIMFYFLDGLGFMHSNGIVHRDIKPENILLLNKPRSETDVCKELKLADFGFSAVVGDTEPLTTCCGTPRYIAPEVLMVGLFHKGSGYGLTCDMWAAGVIAFILIFGKAPFYHKDRDELWRHICHGIYTMPDDTDTNTVSREARHFIQSLIVVDRDKRFTVHQALEHPFITGRGQLSKQHLGTTQDGIRDFNAREKVKGAVLGMQAVSRVTYMRKCLAMGVKANSAVEKKFDTGHLGDDTELLDMRNNYLGPKGIMAVMEMVKEGCPSIKKIDLAGNNVNNTVITNLCDVCAAHPKVEHIDLSDNPLSFNAGMALLSLTKKNPRIQEVVLNNTKVQEGIMNQIHTQLERNRERASGKKRDYYSKQEASPGGGPKANPLTSDARDGAPAP